eukprot:TRINITY_DN2835_c0_g1_i1.p1 TRINITY_DN2835_c0_g1~~TRINITY_DN2835_c0_g1_i1.p1  ORF type:complete len:209 (+),score=22.67 TRINITY_DN2835_c0_g1_i1:123-749(+)
MCIRDSYNESANTPSFRSYHFDSNANPSSISPEQVQWYSQTAGALNAVAPAPALGFFHIPLRQYDTAVRVGNISGHWNEVVSYNGNNSDLFSAFQSVGDVKATFCGHDHTNDFCVDYQGIQLCYEGSPGYQAYGRKDWPRRARVTQIEGFGQRVTSWKRLDDASQSVVDKELLWERGITAELVHERRRPNGVLAPESLPRRSQPGHAH